MKKITPHKTGLLILAMLVLLVSCKKDFLNRPPEDAITDGNYYTSTERMMAATAVLYNLVWFEYNDMPSYGIGDGRAGMMTTGGSFIPEDIRFTSTPVDRSVEQAWRSFFNIIGQSNTIRYGIETYASEAIPEAMKTYAVAECRFMRGMAYYYLVQTFGAVPVIESNTALLTDTSLSRNTIPSVWRFAIRDLRFAAENLPAAPYKPGRITKWSAEGMLAKAYLAYAGVMSNNSGTRVQQFLDSAAYFAKDVIQNSGATLMTDYKDLFLTRNNNNSESLFALQWQFNNPAQYGTQNDVQAFLAFESNTITGFGDGWGGDVGAAKHVLEMYEQGDKRRKVTWFYPGEYYDWFRWKPNGGDVQNMIVPNRDVDGTGGNNRAWVKKYIVGGPWDNNGQITFMGTGMNTYILRLADVYLVYADAMLGNNASTNDGLALSSFNSIRTRAGLSTVSSITWDALYKERWLELAMEGQAWYDLVRIYYYNKTKAFDLIKAQNRGDYYLIPNSNTNATAWTINPRTDYYVTAVSDANFWLPIPAEELTKAPNLNKPPVEYP